MRDLGLIPGSGISPGEGKVATHSSTLAWRIPWMEELGRLQSMGLQSRIRLSDFTSPSTRGLLSQHGGQRRAGEQTQWEEEPCVQRGRLSWSALASCAPALCVITAPRPALQVLTLGRAQQRTGLRHKMCACVSVTHTQTQQNIIFIALEFELWEQR